VILGSGLAGSILAAVLRQANVSVLIVDAGSHPRFAIGESTIPYTSVLMRLVADRFGVPELKALSSFEATRAKVTTAGGVKRHFGFVYHDPEQPDSPQVNQFAIPKILHTENHFFRQAVDAYMLSAAVRYGSDVRQNCRIDDIHIDGYGVQLKSSAGELFRGRFLVDASGHASPVARKYGLRDQPCRFKHHSRSVFTHMIGVIPFDDCLSHDTGAVARWHEGTLHHMFDGGWMWVIPFDNHPRATNPLCSVGLNFDSRKVPRPNHLTAEQEFAAFLDQHPLIAAQFADARAVRPWVTTDRLQYSSKRIIGQRFCLTSHAAGFIDPLFSRGLTNTLEVINALAPRLIAAVHEDDFDQDRFAYVERLEQGLLTFNDELVFGAYASLRDYHSWNAYFRVWALSAVLGTFVLQRAYVRFLETRDPHIFTQLEDQPHVGYAYPGDTPGYRELLALVATTVDQLSRDELDSREAGDRIFHALQSAPFVPPAFGFGDPDNRHYHPSVSKIAGTLLWARTKAPPEIGQLVRDGLLLFMKKRWSPEHAPHLSDELLGFLETNPTLAQWSQRWHRREWGTIGVGK
jgi:tetracycline 7-halogenase / FADH2 O2-dependent halogenase